MRDGVGDGEEKDYAYLIGTTHRDDEDMQLYTVNNVYVHKQTGFIVGTRSLILKDGSMYRKPEPDPIHVKDLVILTNRYKNEREKNLKCNLAHVVNVVSSGRDGEMSVNKELPGKELAMPEGDLFCGATTLDGDVYEFTDGDYERLLRQNDLGDQLVEYCLLTTCRQVEIFTPLTRRQAMASPQREHWIAAERKEIDSFTEN